MTIAVTLAVARRALAEAGGPPDARGTRLAAGRTSAAWLLESATAAWVVRVPIERSGRRASYHVEAHLGRLLADRGHPVARWQVVDIDGHTCSVASALPGEPMQSGSAWTPALARRVAAVLADLHRIPATGFGPLADDALTLRGSSPTLRSGIVDRWCHAPIWPFDASDLADHPIASIAPALVSSIRPRAAAIEAAADGPVGIVHSDLHREHVLVAADGSLTGLLDFGDAFVGAPAWDVALLEWYYGAPNASLVAEHLPHGPAQLARARQLTVAIGLYKVAKNPADRAALDRLARCLHAARP